MSTPQRKPKGYVGINHTTRGGDILAVLQTINLPVQTLGAELAARAKAVKEDQWYPISEMLEVLEQLDKKLGSYHLRQVGWTIFNRFHKPGVVANFTSARQLIEAFDSLYHEGNKGTQIGGYKVQSFEPGRAVLEKATPHHCLMEEGIVEESLRAINIPAKVSQAKCFRKGDDLCEFVIESSVTDERWTG